jgi:hypothetical protein
MDAAFDRVDLTYGREPFGGEQDVVVLGDGARHQ